MRRGLRSFRLAPELVRDGARPRNGRLNPRPQRSRPDAVPDPPLSGRPDRRGAAGGWPARAGPAGAPAGRGPDPRLLRQPAGAGPLRPLHGAHAQPAAGPDQAVHQHRLRQPSRPGGGGLHRRTRDGGGRGALCEGARPVGGGVRRGGGRGLAGPRSRQPAAGEAPVPGRRSRHRRVVGETLATNEKMLHLARKAGFIARPSADVRSLVLLEKSLGATVPSVGCEEVMGGWPPPA